MTNRTQEAMEQQDEAKVIIRTPFDSDGYQPLFFKPHDEVKAAVYAARQLLAKRDNEQCVRLAKALVKMKQIIDAIERKAAMKALKLGENVDTVWLSEGRALMLWLDKFDLSSLKISSLKLHEVFAVKVLMLCADYTKIKMLDIEAVPSKEEKYRRTRLHHIADNQTMLEIIDCLARAEVVERYLSKQNAASLLGAKGGRGRTNKCTPLINFVLDLYVREYSELPVLTAANIIESILRSKNPELLALSKSEDQVRVIEKWIHEYKQKKRGLTIHTSE